MTKIIDYTISLPLLILFSLTVFLFKLLNRNNSYPIWKFNGIELIDHHALRVYVAKNTISTTSKKCKINGIAQSLYLKGKA